MPDHEMYKSLENNHHGSIHTSRRSILNKSDSKLSIKRKIKYQ